MNNLNQEALDGINNLISRNNDAAEGFVEVANNINYPNLTQWLINWAKKHGAYAEELKSVVTRQGEEPTGGTTILGELHHAWVDLKAQFTNNDTEELLEECLRGEGKALADYTDVITERVLPQHIQTVLSNHQSEIKKGIQELEFFKTSYKKVEDTNS